MNAQISPKNPGEENEHDEEKGKRKTLTKDKEFLLQILHGTRPPPYTFAEFEEVAKELYCAELPHFWSAEHKYSALVEHRSEQEAAELAKQIYDHYIKDMAEEQINLSNPSRQDIEEKLIQKGLGGKEKAIFAKGRKEAEQLMMNNIYPLFLKKSFENITEEHAWTRMKLSYFCVAVAMVLLILFMVLQDQKIYPMESRWWRMFTLPFVYSAFASYFSAKEKVCLNLEKGCLKMKKGYNWMQTFKEEYDVIRVVDEFALAGLRRAKRKIQVSTRILTFISMVVIIVVPPPIPYVF